MSNEGFVFENYYNSLWGGSTASGEYSNVTGNFYNAANCLRKSGSTKQPFVLGNQMKKIGYKTYAYHNNTYTYYTRNLSHPNFGYSYKGIGNGLTGLKSCWPRSDYEMAVEASNILFGKATKESLTKLDEQTLLDVMNGVPQYEFDRTLLQGEGVKAVNLTTEAAPCFPSKGEMRKLTQGGGVSLNKEKLTAFDQLITEDDLLDGKYLLVQQGKKKYFLLIAK